MRRDTIRRRAPEYLGTACEIGVNLSARTRRERDESTKREWWIERIKNERNDKFITVWRRKKQPALHTYWSIGSRVETRVKDRHDFAISFLFEKAIAFSPRFASICWIRRLNVYVGCKNIKLGLGKEPRERFRQTVSSKRVSWKRKISSCRRWTFSCSYRLSILHISYLSSPLIPVLGRFSLGKKINPYIFLRKLQRSWICESMVKLISLRSLSSTDACSGCCAFFFIIDVWERYYRAVSA